jgi:uncharacterized protein (TIGR02246 family)
MRSDMESAVRARYHQMIDGWNQRNAEAMAEPFAADGEIIGFDGSQVAGRAAIVAHLRPIFADHPTPPYIVKVRGVRPLGADAALLRAVAGMVPPGKSELDPKLHAVHSLVAVRQDGTWRIALFQNTPAQFHGRPELVEQLTAELQEVREQG